MSNSFEKMNSLIGDTTNMSYEESKEVDLKEMIRFVEVENLVLIERAIHEGLEEKAGQEIEDFSVKNGLSIEEITTLSNAVNYVFENANNNGEDLKVGVKYDVMVYTVPVLNHYSAFDDGINISTSKIGIEFDNRKEIQNTIKWFKTTTIKLDYYIMAIEFNPVDKYDNKGNPNKTVRIVVDEEALIKGFAIMYKKDIKKVLDELIEKSEKALLKANEPA